eukprot:5492190-Pyramimonas_sp.AAC.1
MSWSPLWLLLLLSLVKHPQRNESQHTLEWSALEYHAKTDPEQGHTVDCAEHEDCDIYGRIHPECV